MFTKISSLKISPCNFLMELFYLIVTIVILFFIFLISDPSYSFWY